MKKSIKLCLILTLTLCTFLLSGYGEKDKFDKDHAEVIKLMEQAKAVQTKDLKIRDNDDLTANPQDQQWHDGINEQKAVTDIHKHSAGAKPTYDPFKGHLHFEN